MKTKSQWLDWFLDHQDIDAEDRIQAVINESMAEQRKLDAAICDSFKHMDAATANAIRAGILDGVEPVPSNSDIPDGTSVRLDDDFVVCPNCAYRINFPFIGSTLVTPLVCPACSHRVPSRYYKSSISGAT